MDRGECLGKARIPIYMIPILQGMGCEHGMRKEREGVGGLGNCISCLGSSGYMSDHSAFKWFVGLFPISRTRCPLCVALVTFG